RSSRPRCRPLRRPTCIDYLGYGLFPTGATLAISDGSVHLVDISDRTHPKHLADLPSTKGMAVEALAYSADGHTLLTGGSDGAAVLWNVGDPRSPRQIGNVLSQHKRDIVRVAFSPDSRW